MRRLRSRFARIFDASRIGPVCAVLTANGVACFLFYATQSSALLARVLVHPSLADRAAFLAYCGFILGVASLATVMVSALAASVVSRRALVIGVGLACAPLLLVVFLDNKLFLSLGIHLYDRAVIETLQQSDLEGTLHASRGELAACAALAVGLAGFELALAHMCERRWRALAPGTQRRLLSFMLGTAFAFVAASGAGCRTLLRSSDGTVSALPPILPFHTTLFERDRPTRIVIHPTEPLDYPKTPVVPVLGFRPDVLFIALESLRSDALTPDQMPNVFRFASQRSCIRSAHHHSGSNVTQLGIFSLLYGLDTYYYDAFVNGSVPSYPLDVLKANGYVVGGASSAKTSEWGDMRFMTDQLAPYFEPKEREPWERDAAIERWGEEQLRARHQDRPLFLFLFFDSTHSNYYYPPEFERRTPTVPVDVNRLIMSVDSPDLRARFRHRYENSVMYADALLGRLLQSFGERWQAGRLIVVLTGDHGEELWDEGLWGHGGRLLKSRTEVPLVFCVRGLEAPTVALSSHVDVMPTLLAALGPVPALDPSSYSTGVTLLGREEPDRAILISEGVVLHWNGVLQLVTREHKFTLRQGQLGPTGRHDYALTSLRGPDDEFLDDTPSVRLDLDARLSSFDRSFGSFFRR
jgi:hypothetical protein